MGEGIIMRGEGRKRKIMDFEVVEASRVLRPRIAYGFILNG